MIPNSIIQRPKGEALLYKRDTWNVIYYKNGRRYRKSLATQDHAVATFLRDLFFQDADKHEHKTSDKEDRYIYRQKRYLVKIGKKVVGRYELKSEAKAARDEYQKKNGGDAM